jgi:hypothetical protein
MSTCHFSPEASMRPRCRLSKSFVISRLHIRRVLPLRFVGVAYHHKALSSRAKHQSKSERLFNRD